MKVFIFLVKRSLDHKNTKLCMWALRTNKRQAVLAVLSPVFVVAMTIFPAARERGSGPRALVFIFHFLQNRPPRTEIELAVLYLSPSNLMFGFRELPKSAVFLRDSKISTSYDFSHMADSWFSCICTLASYYR